jgi:hypothetical protein
MTKLKTYFFVILINIKLIRTIENNVDQCRRVFTVPLGTIKEDFV